MHFLYFDAFATDDDSLSNNYVIMSICWIDTIRSKYFEYDAYYLENDVTVCKKILYQTVMSTI